MSRTTGTETGSQIKLAAKPSVRSESSGPPSAYFYGWWVVVACAVGLFFGPPIVVFSFPVFLKPLIRDFHASRAAVSLGFTLNLLVGALTAPLAGWVIDRHGSRKLILSGTAMLGVILILNKTIATDLSRFYLFCIALGFVINGVGPLPYGKVVAVWFDRWRGIALGLMMAGIGAGAMIMPSVAQALITRFGWHTTYACLGCAVLLIPVPVIAAVLKDSPGDLGMMPDGAALTTTTPGNEEIVEGLTAREAWSTGTFWTMACGFFLVSASVQGCLIHLAAMLNDRGITPQTAALGSSLAGAAVLLGRVGTGYMIDRFFAVRVAAFLFGGAVVGIGLLWMASTAAMLLVGAVFVGLGLGAELDLIAFLISRYFGLRAFGKIYSSAFAVFALAAALGPLIMGEGFDLTGSYRLPLGGFCAATLIAVFLMTRLGPYRYRAGSR